MKILKGGKTKQTLKGKCKDCKCVVTVTKSETKELIDRDTQTGMATKYVHCPECDNKYLWVK